METKVLSLRLSFRREHCLCKQRERPCRVTCSCRAHICDDCIRSHPNMGGRQNPTRIFNVLEYQPQSYIQTGSGLPLPKNHPHLPAPHTRCHDRTICLCGLRTCLVTEFRAMEVVRVRARLPQNGPRHSYSQPLAERLGRLRIKCQERAHCRGSRGLWRTTSFPKLNL